MEKSTATFPSEVVALRLLEGFLGSVLSGTVMKGFVPTPQATVDAMVSLLFRDRPPGAATHVLDPGCGTGEFIDGVIRWCQEHGSHLPSIVGVEVDPRHIPALNAKYAKFPSVQIEQRDFLAADQRQFEYIVGNPPYVPITKLSEEEKRRYRASYATARGRFDLYMLFFEQALNNLAANGRLVFITPEKFLYVETAGPLRRLLASNHVEQIALSNESTFGELVTYPTITSVQKSTPGFTEFSSRHGVASNVRLPEGHASWLPILSEPCGHSGEALLADFCLRISCGIATGADAVFVRPDFALSQSLREFSRPTIAGREIKPGRDTIDCRSLMLMPYSEAGDLLPEDRLGALGEYLNRGENKARLLRRTCVAHKPWYAFHETPMLSEILRSKIVCKDICEQPQFVVDYSGEILPRHSVYYLVPHDPAAIPAMVDYLRSDAVRRWLEANGQRAAKGYLRMQSRTLQKLPVPAGVLGPPQMPAPRCTSAENALGQQPVLPVW